MRSDIIYLINHILPSTQHTILSFIATCFDFKESSSGVLINPG